MSWLHPGSRRASSGTAHLSPRGPSSNGQAQVIHTRFPRAATEGQPQCTSTCQVAAHVLFPIDSLAKANHSATPTPIEGFWKMLWPFFAIYHTSSPAPREKLPFCPHDVPFRVISPGYSQGPFPDSHSSRTTPHPSLP